MPHEEKHQPGTKVDLNKIVEEESEYGAASAAGSRAGSSGGGVGVGPCVCGNGAGGDGNGSIPDPSSPGQPHHSKPHKTKKKAVKRSEGKSRPNWRRRLNACRSPSTESIADLPDSHPVSASHQESAVCTSFRRSSSTGSGLTAADWPTDDGEDTIVIHVPRADGPPRPLRAQFPLEGRRHGYARNAAMAPYGQNTLPSVGVNTPAVGTPSSRPGGFVANGIGESSNRGLRNSPFCPCLSPNDSDDEGHREPASSGGNGRRQLCARQIISLARELRTRFVLAADATNQTGPIPANRQRNLGDGVMMAEPYPVHTAVEYTHYLVPDLVKITTAPYYWGVMDRFEAEKLLEGKPEGTFLLRDSAQIEYLFSVSFRRYQRTLHARIEQLNHRFSFDSYDSGVFSAETVTELVDHYSDPARCMLFEPQLSKPLNRNFVFPLQHLCRAAMSASIAYNDIQSLPIPKKFKDYLREYHYRQPVRIRNLEAPN